jgi:hypothetical protein
MARTPIRATSAPPGPTDARHQDMVKELVLSQQKVLVDYGKQLATAAFAAIGLVFTLTDEWLGHAPDPGKVRLLGTAIALFLVTSVLGAAAAGVFHHRDPAAHVRSCRDPGGAEDLSLSLSAPDPEEMAEDVAGGQFDLSARHVAPVLVLTSRCSRQILRPVVPSRSWRSSADAWR